MRTEDGYVVNKCLNGEPEAFGFLMDKYKGSVYAFAYSKLRNFHDAEDVTQEVFIKAYQKLRSLKRWDNFLAWLYAITSNMCKNWIRSKASRPDSEFVEDQNDEVLMQPSLSSYREDRINETLREALDSLPETQRQVLIFHYLGGMSGKEIARFLGISPGAVWERLSRARIQLREEMLEMMSTTFEAQRLQAGFTMRMVEIVKRIKIHPVPRITGLPWGLSLAAGIIITVAGLSPYLSMPSPASIPMSSALPGQMKALQTGQIPVDILAVSQVPALASMQGEGDGGKTDSPQGTVAMAPQAKGDTWTRKADMPTARFLLSACVVDGKIYAMGGGPDPSTFYSTVEDYDPVTDVWTRKANMPTARSALSASAVNGKIYAIGGLQKPQGPAFSIVEEYDRKTDTWTRKSDMPTARAMLTTSVVNGKIYAIGGARGTSGPVFSTVEEYDPATDTWEKKADLPEPRYYHAAGVADGKIYIIAGAPKEWTSSPAVYEYDPATDTWEKKADAPTTRAWLSASVVNGKIYSIGGDVGKGTAIVEEYDPATDTWTRKADMLTARSGLSTSAVNGKIYAIGGFKTPYVGISTVEEYDTGFVPLQESSSIESNGKLTTTWGGIKSD